MHFKSKDITIVPGQPFKNDLFELQSCAQVLTRIIEAAEDGFTLSIDAEWGYGKTTFVKMWQQQLIDDGQYTVYVNAWESDFAQDPMMALVDSIAQEVKLNASDNQTYKILSPIVEGLIKLVKSIPSISLAGKVAEVIKQTIDSVKEDKNTLDEHQTYMSIVEQFKSQLASFTDQLPNKKMIIFVDELDRCRPDYAIEMLERIKHLFDIPNIVFVLSIDRTVILECIKGFYNSSNVNAENYLRRFIDLSFQLPQPSISKFVFAQYNYHALEQSEDSYRNYIDKTYGGKDHHIERLRSIVQCFAVTNRSLRDIEKFFNLLDITLHSVRCDDNNIDFIVWLVYMHIFAEEAYTQLKSSTLSERELLFFLEKTLFREKHGDADENVYMAYCICLIAISYRRQYNLQEMTDEDIKTFKFAFINTHSFYNAYNSATNYAAYCDLQFFMQQIELIGSRFSISFPSR